MCCASARKHRPPTMACGRPVNVTKSRAGPYKEVPGPSVGRFAAAGHEPNHVWSAGSRCVPLPRVASGRLELLSNRLRP
jgi:hypothetical protein